jgi:hypothetical protein
VRRSAKPSPATIRCWPRSPATGSSCASSAWQKSAWLAQPAATRVICSVDCAATIASTVAAGARLVWVEGDLALAGPRTLGSRTIRSRWSPPGALRFDGAITIHGIVHGASLEWNDGAAPGPWSAAPP